MMSESLNRQSFSTLEGMSQLLGEDDSSLALLVLSRTYVQRLQLLQVLLRVTHLSIVMEAEHPGKFRDEGMDG